MIPRVSRKLLRTAALMGASALTFQSAAFAGIMDAAIGAQTYRDFAENRGVFAQGATNVPVYDLNGHLVGTIARMPTFDGTVDAGWSALTGNASFMATVSHNNSTDVTFAQRFGATQGTAFYDTYHFINYNRAWGTNTGYGNDDYATPRLNKIVTEAVAVPYLTDTNILTNLPSNTMEQVRVGGGTQVLATSSGTTALAGAYSFLTGGTIKFSGQTIILPAGSSLPPQPWPTGVTYTVETASGNPGAAYTSYNSKFVNGPASASSPLNIGILPGDSGSATYLYNTNTGRWEYVATTQSYSNNGGFGDNNYARMSPQYAQAIINGYTSPAITPTAGGGNITWNTPDANGNGTLAQGATSWSYAGLAAGLRGATSTGGTAATDAQMDATRNLVFAGAGGTIVLAGSVDMGAGSLTFQNNYTLSDGGVNTRRLNSAGYIIAGGKTVTTTLTGATGDEWRVISDFSTAGTANFVVSGSGTNNADLNLGGNLLTQLNRTSGYAAHNVKINGGGVVVRLMQAGQISGDVIFGHRGGTLDLYGQNWTTDHITHLDNGAEFANLKANADSTFTFTGSGAATYLGGFSDGGSLANGRLNLVYNPATAPGSVWTLSGVNNIAGTVAVSGGELKIAGTPTLHAAGYVDPNDWQTANFTSGTVSVAGGATFTAADHAIVTSNVSVADGGTFQIVSGGYHSGNVALNAANAAYLANIASGAVTESGAITGSGGLTKSGAGTLNLTNTGNTFSGANTINAGIVSGATLASMGGGTANWTVAQPGVFSAGGSTAAQMKAKLTAGSTGTVALAGSNPDNAPDLTGYAGLSLGALGSQTVDTPGITNLLTPWTGGNTGWNLGVGSPGTELEFAL